MQSGRDKVSFRASLVVLLIDDFTGKPILWNQAKVSISGKKLPVIKKDGYRVFLNLKEKEVCLFCESGIYEKKEDRVFLPLEEKVHIIRLLPNRSYPLPFGNTCVSGRIKPKEMAVFWEKKKRGYKLLRKYEREENKEEISIYNPEQKNLIGKAFFIQNKEQREYFRLLEKKKDGYRMDRSLAHSYPKIGTEITPLYEVQADEWGDFFFPLIGSSKEEIVLGGSYFFKEGEWNLKLGSVNEISFEEE